MVRLFPTTDSQRVITLGTSFQESQTTHSNIIEQLWLLERNSVQDSETKSKKRNCAGKTSRVAMLIFCCFKTVDSILTLVSKDEKIGWIEIACTSYWGTFSLLSGVLLFMLKKKGISNVANMVFLTTAAVVNTVDVILKFGYDDFWKSFHHEQAAVYVSGSAVLLCQLKYSIVFCPKHFERWIGSSLCRTDSAKRMFHKCCKLFIILVNILCCLMITGLGVFEDRLSLASFSVFDWVQVALPLTVFLFLCALMIRDVCIVPIKN